MLQSGQLVGRKRLNLSCGLTELPSDILELADSLEILDLSNNCLSTLPDDLRHLKKLRIVFFNNNEFEEFPEVLAACPSLSMVSFKNNNIRVIDEHVLSPTIRWLTLTDNCIEVLPSSIGKLSRLQKLMLAGNRLSSLPDELAACQNLELIRLAANRLQTLPDWLFTLPRLSWLAYAGNPCCGAGTECMESQSGRSLPTLPTIDASELQLGETLGQGASGVIYKARWAAQSTSLDTEQSEPVHSELVQSESVQSGAGQSESGQSESGQLGQTHLSGKHAESLRSTDVAVKLFKGDVTSDGSPLDEMQACIAAGSHPNLMPVLGKLTNSPEGKAGLIFSFVPPDYKNLGNPPSLESCTRDTYHADVSFTIPMILKITRGIASAVAHLHANSIMHGDLYAHNILVNETGESILSDFGAASFYNPTIPVMGPALERLEVRAFGCLLEDLLDRYASADGKEQADDEALMRLRQLQHDCMHPIPTMRPLFIAICNALDMIYSAMPVH